MSSSTSILKILWRYKQREELSEEELTELRLWLMQSPKNEDLFDELSNAAKWDRNLKKWKRKSEDATWNKISKRLESISPEAFKKKRERGRYLVAASLMFIALSGGVYYWMAKKTLSSSQDAQQSNLPKQEILPANGGSILTLSNGNAMILDSLSPGMQTSQGNTIVLKTDSNALSYKTGKATVGNEEFNTLTTGKGNQYFVELSDGTKVWLNATSTLRYPIAFTGAARKVHLTGEGYFEVSKDKFKPFIVETSQSLTVKVTGTHFNVKAYDEETGVKVTLLEGSVSVNIKKDSVNIKPGEQAEVNQTKLVVRSADIDQVIAWKNKIFWFKNDSFQKVMQTLSRWYDINVDYKGEIKETYTGILPYNLPLSSVFNIIEKGGNVHFTIDDGNRVTVRP